MKKIGNKDELEGVKDLVKHIRDIIRQSRTIAARGVNALQVATNYEVGRRIVETEQSGKTRADYGKEILSRLSEALAEEFGRGFSVSNLEYMRKFYLWKKETVLEGHAKRKGQALPDQLPYTITDKSQTPSGEFTDINSIEPAKLINHFPLSWSHYVFLMSVKNSDERCFYEVESKDNNWSIREMKRQFDTGLYERLALSRNKDKVFSLSQKGHVVEDPSDMLKEPYVLEFLGLDESPSYSERELESAIINRLENFLLELGKGFLFEARQKRLTFDSDHYYVDLVFYNRILRCYVLIELKINKLTHQDLGQMQMYVNYFDRNVKLDDEKPTIGIILCKLKNDALVELTLPKDVNVYPREYSLVLPSKKVLKRKLLEWMG